MPDDLGAPVTGAPGANPLSRRYGRQPGEPSPPSLWNDTLETLLTHRSVRRFSDRALPDGLLELLAAAAQSASTSSNLQAMSIVAVQDKDRKARLAALAGGQRHVADAPLLLLFVADLSRSRAVSAELGSPGEGLDYLELFTLAVADASFAAQNTVVAMESLGLGGCYIGAMRNHPREVAAEIGLPPEAFVVFGLTVGYPDPAVATEVKPRLAQSLVLHRERYQAATPRDIAAYDEAMRAFRAGQQMSDVDWSRQVADRVRSAKSLMGRDVMRATLQSMGFALK